jgi:hypothetical protein
MHGGLLSAIKFHTAFGAFRNRMVIILDTNRVGNDDVCLVGHGGALLVLFESPTPTL